VAEETRPGRVIGGRYRLTGELAAGGFGRVWRAWDTVLDVEVAVKEVWLHPGISGPAREEMLRRAPREARNAARLRNHPNIVTVHDVVIEDGAPWTVMQLVSGRSLHEHVSEQGPLEPETAQKAARALLSALAKAHEAGIVHRDVKPANVMLAADGDVLLTDFGIAVQQGETRLTAPGTFIGTADYLAPERIRGRDERPASDLFSLGATLYFAVEGVPPFHRGTPDETYGAILMEDPPWPQRAGGLAPLIERLLRKDPDRRPTAARALELLDLPPTKVVTAPGRREQKKAGADKPKKAEADRPKKSGADRPKQGKSSNAPKGQHKPESKYPPKPQSKKPQPATASSAAKSTRPARSQTRAKQQPESSDHTWLWVVGIAAAVSGLLYAEHPGFAEAVTDSGFAWKVGLSGELGSAAEGDCLHREENEVWVRVPCWSAVADRTVTRTYSLSEYSTAIRGGSGRITGGSPCRSYGGREYQLQERSTGRTLCTRPKE
jgi:serine/threonine protein kinase